MPVLSFGFPAATPSPPDPRALALVGPVVPAQVLIHRALEEWLTSQKRAVPPPVSGLALIDTDATKSGVDMQVIATLGVSPIHMVELATAGGSTRSPLYPARFVLLPGRREHLVLSFDSVVGVDLAGLKVGGQNVIALVGRDVLTRCMFVYNGLQSMFSLAL